MMRNWFLCKTHYQKAVESGESKKVNEAFLVDAILFGEAEIRIAKELEPFVKKGEEMVIDDISRFVIDHILEEQATDEDDRYYRIVKAMVILNEETGDEKRNPYKYLVKASTAERALDYINEYNKDSFGDWVTVEIKETPIMDIYYYSSDGAIADIVNSAEAITPTTYIRPSGIEKYINKEVLLSSFRLYVEDVCNNDGRAINIKKRTISLIRVGVQDSFDFDKLKKYTLELIQQSLSSDSFSRIANWYLGCLKIHIDYITENYNTWKEAFIDEDTGEQVWITRCEKK